MGRKEGDFSLMDQLKKSGSWEHEELTYRDERYRYILDYSERPPLDEIMLRPSH